MSDVDRLSPKIVEMYILDHRTLSSVKGLYTEDEF